MKTTIDWLGGSSTESLYRVTVGGSVGEVVRFTRGTVTTHVACETCDTDICRHVDALKQRLRAARGR